MTRKLKLSGVILLTVTLLFALSCAGGSLPRESTASSSVSTVTPSAGTAPSLSPSAPLVTQLPAVSPTSAPATSPSPPAANESSAVAELIKRYAGIVPKEWDLKVTGVATRLDTMDKVVAFTFDACGGKGGNGYDKALIDYLVKENVPATLFINSRWIDENGDVFLSLSKNSLFEIENHGTKHLPLSVSGKSAYGITGTASVAGVIDEVLPNAEKIYRLTGKKPLFFRSGTDYYDEVAVSVAAGLGITAVGFSVLGDAGATYSAAQIKKTCLAAKPGDIIICHMNHPEKDTAEGIIEAVPALRALGFRFVKLEDYKLK